MSHCDSLRYITSAVRCDETCFNFPRNSAYELNEIRSVTINESDVSSIRNMKRVRRSIFFPFFENRKLELTRHTVGKRPKTVRLFE